MLQLSRVHWGKILLCHNVPIPRLTKTCFPTVSELCKDTPGTQCTILWEKRSGERVLWELSTIPVVNLIRWTGTGRRLPSMKWQAPCCFFFLKTQKLHESCGCNKEKINQCLSIRVEAAIIQLPEVENITFTIRDKFPGSQKHVYWQFQSSVKTNLGPTVSSYEKRSQGSAFCKCQLPYVLLLWSSESVLPDDFLAENDILFISESSISWTLL